MLIGVISDTHGLLRPQVFTHFAGVEHVLHAGDIGPPDILTSLEAIAPVTAVSGNTDGFEIRRIVPVVADLVLAGRRIIVVHGHHVGSPSPETLATEYDGDVDIVVFGHSHVPLIERYEGRLYLNPGGAGAPRFGVRPSIMLLTLSDGGEEARLIKL